MENLKTDSHLSIFLESFFEEETEVNVIDLGCSGGPDQFFLQLNKSKIIKLKYIGIDFNSKEILRLSKIYDGNFVFLDREIVISEKNYSNEKNSFLWDTFSASEAKNFIDITVQSDESILSNNFWDSSHVSKSVNKINMENLISKFMSKCDLLKIDLDGPDFDCLKDFFDYSVSFPSFISLEINYQGEYTKNSNTFGNVDKFMKEKGYILLALTSRTYGNKIFPRKFQYEIFAQNIGGIPFQGDAVYFKADSDKTNLLTDVILLDGFYQEDLAADLLFKNKNKFNFDIYLILDFLTLQYYNGEFKNYHELMSEWTKHPHTFFPQIKNKEIKSEFNLYNVPIKTLLKILFIKIFKQFFFIDHENRLIK